jgi:hypothetical protein
MNETFGVEAITKVQSHHLMVGLILWQQNYHKQFIPYFFVGVFPVAVKIISRENQCC